MRLSPPINFLQPLEYPVIENVTENVKKPFWSVMIPTYNGERFLKRTLESVLEQGFGTDEIQIEVIDDCSDQQIKIIVEHIGKGRVGFYRQDRHVGISRNWNTCLERARGHWVQILNHDDIVMPGYYATYKKFIEEHPDIVLVFCRAIAIDENDEWKEIMYPAPDMTSSGIVKNATHKMAIGNFVVTSTAVVARDVYTKLGGFTSDLNYCTDWEMWMRVAAEGPVGYIHQPYLLYRYHSDNETKRLQEEVKDMRELVRTNKIGIYRLSPGLRKKTRSAAYRNYSKYANDARVRLHSKNQHRVAVRFAYWSFWLRPSARNMWRLFRSILRALKAFAVSDHFGR